MIYMIGVDWKSELPAIIQSAAAQDVIECESIPAYNLAISLLTSHRPGVMIYVRISGWKYFPRLHKDDDDVSKSEAYGLGPLSIFGGDNEDV